jgi:hypothetical protein
MSGAHPEGMRFDLPEEIFRLCFTLPVTHVWSHLWASVLKLCHLSLEVMPSILFDTLPTPKILPSHLPNCYTRAIRMESVRSS